jgi:hypothetical protein
MISKLSRKVLFIVVFSVILLLVISSSHGQQIQGNFTISSSYTLTANLNYTGWIILQEGNLNTNNYNIQAKGVVIDNSTFLVISSNSQFIGVTYLYNNGNISYFPNFLNVTYLYNNGEIIHQNWFSFYRNLLYSYGGSGGGGGTNYGSGATEGYNTRVNGGGIPSGFGSQAPLLGNISYPIFNQSLLSGAAGGNSSCTSGAFGAYGFIINTNYFQNFGEIINSGQNAPEVCYGSLYQGGGGGAGGGGVLEIIFSEGYTNNGKYNLNGGNQNYDLNGPWTYGGFGGAGGAGQLILVKTNEYGIYYQNSTNTINDTNNSGPIENRSVLSSINNTIQNLTNQLFDYKTELTSLEGVYNSLILAISSNRQCMAIGENYNYSNDFYRLYNYSAYITNLIRSEIINTSVKPAVFESPTLWVENLSGFSIIGTNSSENGQSYSLSVKKPGNYSIKVFSGDYYMGLDLEINPQEGVITKTGPQSLLSTFLSGFFFLPMIIYNLLV